MKKLFLFISAFSIVLTGCGKKEDPAAVAAEDTALAAEDTAEAAEETMEDSMSAVSETTNSLMASGSEKVKDAVDVAKAKVAEVDFTNMTWDKVSNVPFEDKMQLATWATSRADSWKDKLKDAAGSQGLNMLSNMGDSGWQSALKKVMESINAVRESSPETYEMARGALVSAWTTFEKQAGAILGN